MALTKVFRIELTGGKDVEKDLTAIKKTMASMATAIAKAKGELAALLVTKGDPAEITKLIAKISQLEAKMKSLSQERKKAEADAKTQAQAEKLLADAKLKTAQADKAAAQAEESRIKSQIAQEKELDRQIDREKKETQELQKKKNVLDGLPGSYNALKKSAQELYAELKKANSTSTITTGGKSFSYDQAIAEYKRLSAAEQDFRRQFVKDGTLVGEYASGIVDAFKRLNIDDIIKDQVTGAKNQIGELEKKTQELSVAYRQAQKEGSQDLDKLQKEIHDNVVETEKLKKSVKDTEVQLRGMGGVGDQITGAINKNFKELKNNASQLLVNTVK
jgi:DNA repair exonuclease SbcCD ATPase subunit